MYRQDYAWDKAGNLIYQKEQIEDFATPGTFRTRTVFNEYDNLYRLQAETIGDAGAVSLTEYDYDDANNRTDRRKDTDGDGTDDEVATYDYTGGWNQLQYYTEEDANGNVLRAVNFLYDANGNRSERNAILKTYNPDNSVASTTTENDVYSWDKENRLTGVIDDIGGSSNTYTYAYDYRTRRIVRDESAGVDNQGNPGVSTSLVFSGGTSTQEWESSQLGTAATAGNISGSARPDVTFVRGSDWGGGVGGVLYSLRADVGTTNYSAGFNFYNSRGDVIAKTDDTGAFTWQGEYQADGTRTHEVGENKDRQRGNTKDEDPTGLLCEGFRYRDLETMTWLSKDPAGFVDGPNLYCYVNQNPWTKFDPLGLTTGFEPMLLPLTGGGGATAGGGAAALGGPATVLVVGGAAAVAIGYKIYEVSQQPPGSFDSSKPCMTGYTPKESESVDHFAMTQDIANSGKSGEVSVHTEAGSYESNEDGGWTQTSGDNIGTAESPRTDGRSSPEGSVKDNADGNGQKREKIGKFLEGDDVAEARDHAKEVGRVTGVVDRAGAKARRKERMKNRTTVPEKDRDEFPPATIKPDDPSKISVKPIDRSHNRRSGRRLRDELPPDGTPVEIDP